MKYWVARWFCLFFSWALFSVAMISASFSECAGACAGCLCNPLLAVIFSTCGFAVLAVMAVARRWDDWDY